MPSSTSGADTVTVTDSGSTNDFDLIIAEYSGNTGTFTFDSCSPGANGSGSPVSTGSLYTGNSSGDLLLASVYNENSGSLTFTCGSGYTNQQTTSNPDGASSALCDNQTGASANTSYSTSTTVSGGGSGNNSILASFRSTLPTVGGVQYTQFTTSTSQAFVLPNASGDMLIALLRYTTPWTVTPPTDTQGNTWVMLPPTFNEDGGDEYALAYVLNAKAGANTVSLSGSTGTGMELWEYTGLNTVSPLAGSSAFDSAVSSSTVNPGTVSTPSQSVLFSIGALLGGTGGTTFTPASGYVPRTYWTDGSGGGQDSFQQWDEVVSAGSYGNAITASNAGSYLQAFTLALSTTSISYPVLRQYGHVGVSGTGSDTSLTLAMRNNVVAGDLLVFASASQPSSSTGTVSDTQGNTYHLLQGGSSNLFGLWWTVASSSGALSATITNANCASEMEFANTPSPSLDQTNGAGTTGTSLSTGNITTTAANELVVGVGYSISSSYRTDFSSMSSGYDGVLWACGAHYAAAWAGFESQESIGTYSNTFTWSNSMTLGAAIASFKLSSGSHPNMPPAVY